MSGTVFRAGVGPAEAQKDKWRNLLLKMGSLFPSASGLGPRGSSKTLAQRMGPASEFET